MDRYEYDSAAAILILIIVIVMLAEYGVQHQPPAVCSDGRRVPYLPGKLAQAHGPGPSC